MSSEAILKQSSRRMGILALALSLFACVGLPDWSDTPDASQSSTLPENWEFPDLSQLPTPPAPPPSVTTHDAAVQALETARLQNQRASENLSSQIENNFEYPTAASNQ